jgi:hypothetical protein
VQQSGALRACDELAEAVGRIDPPCGSAEAAALAARLGRELARTVWWRQYWVRERAAALAACAERLGSDARRDGSGLDLPAREIIRICRTLRLLLDDRGNRWRAGVRGRAARDEGTHRG